MKQKIKYILFIGSIVGMLLSIQTVTSEPSVETITLDPEEPEPLATITFTAVVTSEETINEVWLIVKECKNTSGQKICFVDSFNVTMAPTDIEDTYEATITLSHDDATYITYNLNIFGDDTWYQSTDTELDLNLEPPNGNNSSTDGNKDKTPGFESFAFFLACGLILFVIKRKRFR